MKLDRQNVIMEIISQRDIETQNQLLEALAERGVKSTQATLSRDIRDMRLIKELGPNGNYRYVMAASQDTADTDARLKKIFKECVLSYDVAQNILVIKTLPGLAQAAGSTLDGDPGPCGDHCRGRHGLSRTERRRHRSKAIPRN